MAASETGMSLFHIERDLAVLVEARDEADTPEGVAACDQAIAEYMQRSVTKADNIIGLILHDESRIAACKAEEKRIAEFRRGLEDRVERVRKATQYALEAAGKKSVEGRTGKLSVRGNGGKAPLDVYDQTKIPARYEVIVFDINREAIRQDLEAGKEVPGARLLERGKHLSIT